MVNEKGEKMIWWVGADGEENSYWDASHKPSEHVCACKKDLSCTRDLYPCNCDAGREELVSDTGILGNKSALPVMEIKIGGMAGADKKFMFDLGPLVCSGQEVSISLSISSSLQVL
jgi:hypothetical protein